MRISIITAVGSDSQAWRKNPFLSSLTAPFIEPIPQAVSRVDQKSILLFLHLKGLSAKAKHVHSELVQVLRSDAIAYSTVTKNIRNDAILQKNQKPMIERKIKVSRLQTMQFWRHLKWCHLPLFARSLRWPPSLSQLYIAAWRDRFASSWSDSIGFLTNSRIFKTRLLRSCQRSYGSCLIPWDIIRGRISWCLTRPGSIFLSFYLSIFLLIRNQFSSVQKMKLHKGREKLYHLWRWCWRLSGTHMDFTWLMSDQRAADLTLGRISL
jgi:hypothetical protein